MSQAGQFALSSFLDQFLLFLKELQENDKFFFVALLHGVFNIEHLVMGCDPPTTLIPRQRRERNSVDHYLSLIDLI